MSAPRAASAIAASQPGATLSSASQKAMKSPAAACAPVLRAWLSPRWAEASATRSQGSRAPKLSTISSVRSVEPLSTTTTSNCPS